MNSFMHNEPLVLSLLYEDDNIYIQNENTRKLICYKLQEAKQDREIQND